MFRLWPCVSWMVALCVPALAADPVSTPVLVLNAEGHTAKISKLCFSPDGKSLVTASDDKTLRLWSVATGKCERVLRLPVGAGLEGRLSAVAISPDARTLAAAGQSIPASEEGKIYLISVQTGQVTNVLRGHSRHIRCLAFSPDGKWLASGSTDFTARIWDVAQGRCKHTLSEHTQMVRAVAFSPDSSRLVTGSFDYTARIWSVPGGETLAELRGHRKEIGCVAWSPDGQTVALGGRDQSLSLWHASGKRRARYTDMGNEVTAVAFTADSRAILYTLGGDGEKNDCGLLDLTTDKDRVVFSRHDNTVSDGVLSPDGSLAASCGGSDPQVYLWRTADASVVHRLIGKGRTTWSVAWGQDGQTIAWGNTRTPGRDISAMPLQRAFSLQQLHSQELPSQKWKRNGPQRGATRLQRSGLATVEVYEENNRVSTLRLPRTEDVATGFALLTEGRAVVGSIFGLYLFDSRSGKLLRSFRGHSSIVWAMAQSPDGRYLLTCSLDQTLRVWHLDQDLPLLSLFFAGQEWIAWTPEGYYAASLGGEQLIGWQVNNGSDKMGSFYPASQFRKKLYRPDVIKRLLAAGSLSKALAQADAARGQKTQQTEVAHILPPRVHISSPARLQLELKEGPLEVRAVAHSVGGRAITSMQLLLDGRPYPSKARATAVQLPHVGEVQATWKVELPPGRHRLTVKAASSDIPALSEVLDVSYAPPGELAPAGNLYVLAIGINTYPGKLALNGAAFDARAIERVFKQKSRRLFSRVESRLLVDRQATRENIFKELRWLKSTAKTGDVAVVFYAGHGDCKIAQQFYILPVDVRIRELSSTGISGEQLKRQLGQLPCNTVLMLDACYAGSIGRKGKLPASAEDLLRELRYEEMLVVMCGAAKEHEAQEESGHGYFTKALVTGLSGGAADKDGLVFVDDLQPYVRRQVLQMSGGEQQPTYGVPPTIRAFALSRP